MEGTDPIMLVLQLHSYLKVISYSKILLGSGGEDFFFFFKSSSLKTARLFT